MPPRFGISTHLFHGQRLDRAHLAAIKAHGFDLVEVYATRTHFDYHDVAAANTLGEWLAETGVALHGMHAPTTVSYSNGVWGDTLTIGAADEAARRQAVEETIRAVDVARTLPYSFLVLHLGVPDADDTRNSRASVARSLEDIGVAAADAGVTVAIELIPNSLSQAARLVQWLEDDVELPRAGICLDVGHAHLTGDAMAAIEECSGHIVTTHLHDNRRRRDDHLVPGRGSVDWEGVAMAFRKVGYDGAWIFELAPADEPAAVLADAAAARDRIIRWLDMDMTTGLD
ncbi:MAG: sugar phosphate isomerase/epimerase [Acidobacteria bacterium]|nr:sugar phosphate isomerase/epimerase [Acidobacteriota bacterium]